MSRKCTICQRGSIIARKLNKLRGKFNPSPKKRKYPNLQWVRVPIDIKNPKFKPFAGQRVKACINCIKTLSKTK